MIGLLFRKAFFDFWDNVVFALLLNVVADLVVFLPLILPSLVASWGPAAVVAVVIFGVVLVFLFGGVVNGITWSFSKGERFVFSELGRLWSRSWRPSLALAALSLVVLAGVFFGLPFYSRMNSAIGVVLFAVLVWVLVLAVLMIQYIWPMNAQIEPKVGKLLRKSLLLFLDNAAFTLFLAVSSSALIVLSVFTLGLFPGFSGVLLWNQTAVKLRLYKYDYLETIPEDKDRRKAKIPWKDLLQEENDRVGKRTLRGMIFPWKE